MIASFFFNIKHSSLWLHFLFLVHSYTSKYHREKSCNMKPCICLRLKKWCLLKSFIAYSIAVCLINLVQKELLTYKYPINYENMIKLFRDFECLQYEFQHNYLSSNRSDLHRMHKVAMLTFKKFIADLVNFRDLIDRFDQIIILHKWINHLNQIELILFIAFCSSIMIDFPFLVEFSRYIRAAWLIQEQIRNM